CRGLARRAADFARAIAPDQTSLAVGASGARCAAAVNGRLRPVLDAVEPARALRHLANAARADAARAVGSHSACLPVGALLSLSDARRAAAVDVRFDLGCRSRAVLHAVAAGGRDAARAVADAARAVAPHRAAAARAAASACRRASAVDARLQ